MHLPPATSTSGGRRDKAPFPPYELADDADGWKPDRFGFEVLGCRHHLHFPVVRQLTRRFGPLTAETRARLQTATLEQLERWAENILDATTLEDVFKDH